MRIMSSLYSKQWDFKVKNTCFAKLITIKEEY